MNAESCTMYRPEGADSNCQEECSLPFKGLILSLYVFFSFYMQRVPSLLHMCKYWPVLSSLSWLEERTTVLKLMCKLNMFDLMWDFHTLHPASPPKKPNNNDCEQENVMIYYRKVCEYVWCLFCLNSPTVLYFRSVTKEETRKMVMLIDFTTR